MPNSTTSSHKSTKHSKIVTTTAALALALTTSTALTLITSNTNKVYAQDITPPITSYTQTPSSPDGNNGWYKSVVQFDLQAEDLESGVKEINYRIDGGTWQKRTFSNTLNLAPNPSMETPSALTTSGVDGWEASVLDLDATYSQDILDSAPSYPTSSAKIEATAGLWHGINNKDTFAVATPFDNMTASLWIKTQNALGNVYFTVYAIAPDGLGGEIVQQVGQSAIITGTNGWTKLSLDFVVSLADATGVYIDVGLEGSGTVWVDAVNINSSSIQTNTTFTVGADNTNHTVEFYSVDNANNIEYYSCTAPIANCVTFKQDITPPGNWHDSGAFRGFFGPSYHLWTYTNVEDATSGLSVFSDKYQYHTELEPGFGRYSNFLDCGSTWRPDDWIILISPPFVSGAKEAFMLAPKTSFCNSDWKQCKIVRFYARDMAGNESTKQFCINGPWVKFRGQADVGSNSYIDMLSEADGDNTDGLVYAGDGNIDFFTSSQGWELEDRGQLNFLSYSDYWDLTNTTKEEIDDNNLRSASAVYFVDGDFEITSSNLPGDYATDTFNQIVFVNGNLRISTDVQLDTTSAALFIVNGDVEVSKTVTEVEIGIFAEGDFYTAYDIEEGDDTETLEFRGLYNADQFFFQRTLQGTDNNDIPSEDITYEPKYLLNLKDYFGNTTVRWRSVE